MRKGGGKDIGKKKGRTRNRIRGNWEKKERKTKNRVQTCDFGSMYNQRLMHA